VAFRKGKEEEVMNLRKGIDKAEAKNKDLEAACETLTKASKDFEKRVIELETTLQKSQNESEGRMQEIDELNKQMTDLKSALDEGTEKYRCLNAEAIQSKEALMGMLSYCVKLNELDLTKT
jgi:chromosome segregation ATPase